MIFDFLRKLFSSSNGKKHRGITINPGETKEISFYGNIPSGIGFPTNPTFGQKYTPKDLCIELDTSDGRTYRKKIYREFVFNGDCWEQSYVHNIIELDVGDELKYPIDGDGVCIGSIKHPTGPMPHVEINDDALEVMPRPSSWQTHFTCQVCNKNRHMDDIGFIKWYSSDGCCEWSERALYCNDSEECKKAAENLRLNDVLRIDIEKGSANEG